MNRDLTDRAVAAVASIPIDLTGSPTHHAVVTVRRSYLRDGLPMPRFTDMVDAVTDRLNDWNRHIRVDIGIGGCRLHIAELGASMYIEYIEVPRGQRRGGYGAAMLSAVTAWADRNGLRLELGVSTEYGVSRRALNCFYQAHGFQPSGRVGMVRQPTTVPAAL